MTLQLVVNECNDAISKQQLLLKAKLDQFLWNQVVYMIESRPNILCSIRDNVYRKINKLTKFPLTVKPLPVS